MNKILSIAVLIILGFGLILPSTVGAQDNSDVKGVQTVDDCLPGPYGICIPDTGIIFTEDKTTNSAIIAGSVAVFIVGTMFVINGAAIKNRYNEVKA